MGFYNAIRNIGKKGVVLSSLIGALTLGIGGAAYIVKTKNEATKYMIIYTGASYREGEQELMDPNDKNAWWISTAKVYGQALKNGYKAENIFVLYKDGKPDFSDPAINDIKDIIEKEFQGNYSNIASKENLFRIEEGIEQKMDGNDVLTLSFNMHGKPYLLISEHDQTYIGGEDISKMLKDNKSKNNLIVIESCHSESIIKFISVPSTIITSCKEGKWGWMDRDFSFGTLFFESKNDLKNDANGNGLVDDKEAFQDAKIKYKKIGFSKKGYIKKQWVKKGLDGVELKIYMKMYDFTPVIVEK